MHYGLTDEHHMIADTVRSFVENEIYPFEELVERTGEVPADLASEIKRKTKELGFYACNFPESVGGGRVEPFGIRARRTRTWPRLDGADPLFWSPAEYSDGLSGRTD